MIQWFLDRKINKSLKPIHRNGFTGYFAVRVSFAIFTPAWNGEELTVRSSFLNVNGKDKVSLEGKFDGQPGFINMGLVNEKDISQVPNGWTGRVKIYAKSYENDKYPRKMSANDVCTSLYCFSVDMEQSDIDDFMNDHWSNHSRFNPL